MSPTRARVAAGLVHAYTATGSVLALLMVHYSYRGEVTTVLWLFLAAMVVDGTDGFLARHYKVKAVMPGFDGALLDNIVDYMTYALAPMALLWANGYLPGGVLGAVCAGVPLLASCYQFCRSDAKTDDHFFLGFPSYWNIVAFYIVVAAVPVGLTVALLILCTIAVFVPVKYVYPSRTATLWGLNMTFACVWLVMFAVITALMPDPPLALVAVSLAYPAYYLGVSIWLTVATSRSTSPVLV
ncbi:CDP-alcohol phosphatidyltransferase family protein [Nocardioides donggukensis]|uniref:Phosphatidylcholine synthase n=1 Tax=Nocardioides donggukensis TaxID=2774019 RepID=A0A927K9Q3_9ACTN|nr:CDP-alcohol phosphatidyltransferase family protein [Nocardioides donggukensis]MBD8870356.1 CDP-alcohol phosphatidyltransferase family protein [Nocardioides donggukensis]